MATNEVICFYHANCLDGIGSAAIVKKAYSQAQCFPVMYDKALPIDPEHLRGATVFIVDFSFSADFLCEIAEYADRIVLIDHHKTADKLRATLLPANVILCLDTSNEKYSGVGLTWQYFNIGPRSMPPILSCIQSRDLWKFDVPNTREVTAALYMHRNRSDIFELLFSYDVGIDGFYTRLLNEGTVLVAKMNADIESAVKRRYMIQFAGYRVPCVNSTLYTSEIGGILAKDHPFSVVWSYINGKFAVSLRSAPDGVDVSEIAVLVGGGGHKHAAGCSVNVWQFDEVK